jgi:hypothetical protein
MEDGMGVATFFLGILLGIIIGLMLMTSSRDRFREFSNPYRELVEAMCPGTQPQVYIDSNKIIRIVYDCSK